MKLRKRLKLACSLLLNAALLLSSTAFALPAKAASNVEQIYSWPTILSKSASDPMIVTKGVTYQNFTYQTTSGPIVIHESWVDLDDPNVQVKTVMSGDKLENDHNETVSQMANRTGAVVGTNGDYFEMSGSGMALNMTVDDGKFIHDPSQSVVLGIDGNNHVTLGKYSMLAQVTATNGKTFPISALNGHPVSYPNGIVMLTPELGYWEMASNATVVTLQKQDGNSYKVVSLEPAKTVVEAPYAGSIKLLAQGTNAINFVNGNVRQGDMLNVTYGTTPDSSNLKYAIGGEVILLKDGQAYKDPNPPQDGFQNVLMPLTAVGVTQDGKRMVQMVVDGRSRNSIGLNYGQMTNYMAYRGLYNAMLFDGGGSTEMVVRQAGDTKATVANNPSDGTERRVANGLFVFSTSMPGVPTHITVNDGQGLVLFRNQTAKISGYVRDENYNPLPGAPLTYSVQPETLGTVMVDGTFVAGSTAGTGKIIATAANGATGEIPVSVYATVDSLSISPTTTDVGNGESQTFQVTGVFQGKSIGLNPTFLTWSTSNTALGSFAKPGVFTAANTGKGTTTLTATLGGKSASATVGIGYVQKTLDPLTDASKWVRTSRWGEVGTLSTSTAQVQGGKSASLAVNYNFAPSNSMKQFVFYPKATMSIPSADDNAAVNPIGIGAWVYSDGSDLKMLASFARADGTTFQATNNVLLDWAGWKYVTFKLPSSATFPLTLDYLDIYDDAPTGSTLQGSIYFSDLQTLYAARGYSEKPPKPVTPPGVFADTENHWAKDIIASLVQKQVVVGVDADHYAPDRGLNRSEAVSLIVRALKLPTQTTTTFSDVKSNSWYAGAVGAAVKAGIVNGLGDGTFAPDVPVDRNQAAVMIYNALKVKGKTPTGGTPISFKDASDIKSYAVKDINALSAAGLMNGDGTGYLHPTKVTTRAESAAMIYNMMKYAGLL